MGGREDIEIISSRGSNNCGNTQQVQRGRKRKKTQALRRRERSICRKDRRCTKPVFPEIHGRELLGSQVSLGSEPSVSSKPVDEIKQYKDRIADELVRLKEMSIVSGSLLEACQAWSFELREEITLPAEMFLISDVDDLKVELTKAVIDRYKNQLL